MAAARQATDKAPLGGLGAVQTLPGVIPVGTLAAAEAARQFNATESTLWLRVVAVVAVRSATIEAPLVVVEEEG